MTEFLEAPILPNYHQGIFYCTRLRLSQPVIFRECCFPNLRLIEIVNDMPMPFYQCKFKHALNLRVIDPVVWVLPEEVVIRSVSTICQAEISWGDETHYLDDPGEIINEYHLELSVPCGSSPESALVSFKEEFASNTVCFAKDSPRKIFTETTLSVWQHNEILGQVHFKISDDPFSVALITLGAAKTLLYVGDIPNNWSNRARKEAKERCQQLKQLSIEGDLGDYAFAELRFNLKKLSVTGTLGIGALSKCQGEIEQLKVGQIGEYSLDQCEVHLHQVHLNQLHEYSGLEAEVVSVRNSKDIVGVQYAQMLIIREEFREPLDLQHLEATLIDFTMVTHSGPFILRNFADQSETCYAQPDLAYQMINGTISGFSLADILEEILEKMEEHYTGSKFIVDDTNIPKILIKIPYKSRLITIGKWKVQLCSLKYPLIMGALAMVLMIGANMLY